MTPPAEGPAEEVDVLRADLAAAHELVENLKIALETHRTIAYAVGVLLADGGRSPEDAFELLVKASQRENRKLHAIARDLVTRKQERRPRPGLVRSVPVRRLS
jgi:AmiR/NasT family two-component response regulator